MSRNRVKEQFASQYHIVDNTPYFPQVVLYDQCDFRGNVVIIKPGTYYYPIANQSFKIRSFQIRYADNYRLTIRDKDAKEYVFDVPRGRHSISQLCLYKANDYVGLEPEYMIFEKMPAPVAY